jgi:hypothetical protein
MAKMQSGLFGPISGKIGGTVGSVWKGIPTMRTKPVSVANPRTPAQTAQRDKFSNVVSVARLLLSSLIQPYWDPFARRMSGYNSFVRANIGAFDDSGLATPADFNAARGSLLGITPSIVQSFAVGNDVELTWTDNTGQSDALATDIVRLLVYNETQNKWDFSPTATYTRDSEGGFFLTATEVNSGDVLHCYTFAVRPDTSKISDSNYATITIA